MAEPDDCDYRIKWLEEQVRLMRGTIDYVEAIVEGSSTNCGCATSASRNCRMTESGYGVRFDFRRDAGEAAAKVRRGQSRDLPLAAPRCRGDRAAT